MSIRSFFYYLLLDYFHSLWLGSTIFDFLSWLGFRSLLPCQPRRRIACPLAVTTNSIIGNWNSFGPGLLCSLETRFFDWWIVSEWALVFPGPWYRNLPLSSSRDGRISHSKREQKETSSSDSRRIPITLSESRYCCNWQPAPSDQVNPCACFLLRLELKSELLQEGCLMFLPLFTLRIPICILLVQRPILSLSNGVKPALRGWGWGENKWIV